MLPHWRTGREGCATVVESVQARNGDLGRKPPRRAGQLATSGWGEDEDAERRVEEARQEP